MKIKRRKFLIISTLGGLTFAGLGKILANANSITTANSAAELLNSEIEIPAEEPLLRFVSIGDTGTGAEGQYAVAKAMNQYYQESSFPLVIMAGDNIYNNGEIEKINLVFERPYQFLLEQGVKFHACLGNHDIRTENGVPQTLYPNFNMQGQRYYTFRADPVQYFALDTNGNADWETELAWLETELSQSNAAWKVVFGHHQLYASGAYGFNKTLVPKLTPLFKKYGVQLYINGHEHHYERTNSIDGTTYLISGAGGGTRPVERSSWTAYSASRLSFAAYDVYPDIIVVKGIGTDGTIFDRGIILRQ
ncbi:MAG: metallophosphoesterase [Oscillatoria sp. PMC 1051.18]|nr:metallophosphoesterase [Oscillatoria sp. PMC 1050.18]MEC5031945.1 metallophosphoesterase [Oscillatoria sp. PMC 1051.18]